MLFDVCDEHAHCVLDAFYKAESEDGSDIWRPHENPYIRRIVELFTERGLARIASVRAELGSWLSGSKHKHTHERPPRPVGAMARWSEAEIALTKLYLESLHPDTFTYDDWALLIDYLVQRYLPLDDLRTEAEWLATRAIILGRMAAARQARDISTAAVDNALVAMPPTIEAADALFGLTPHQRAIMEYGNAHAAENVVALTDAQRHRLRRNIMDYLEQARMQTPGARESLETRLGDVFADWNRDWRRIALTETGELANQGLIASLTPGRKVKRIEKYQGACSFCRSINGKIFEVVAPDAPDKDGDTRSE